MAFHDVVQARPAAQASIRERHREGPCEVDEGVPHFAESALCFDRYRGRRRWLGRWYDSGAKASPPHRYDEFQLDQQHP